MLQHDSFSWVIIDGVDVRLRRAEKEKAEQQAEKERLSREVEVLTQRLNLLQRQLEKQQVSSRGVHAIY